MEKGTTLKIAKEISDGSKKYSQRIRAIAKAVMGTDA